jgi:hypothetical protein
MRLRGAIWLYEKKSVLLNLYGLRPFKWPIHLFHTDFTFTKLSLYNEFLFFSKMVQTTDRFNGNMYIFVVLVCTLGFTLP